MIIETEEEYRLARKEYEILQHVPIDSPEGTRMVEIVEAMEKFEEDVWGLYVTEDMKKDVLETAPYTFGPLADT